MMESPQSSPQNQGDRRDSNPSIEQKFTGQIGLAELVRLGLREQMVTSRESEAQTLCTREFGPITITNLQTSAELNIGDLGQKIRLSFTGSLIMVDLQDGWSVSGVPSHKHAGFIREVFHALSNTVGREPSTLSTHTFSTKQIFKIPEFSRALVNIERWFNGVPHVEAPISSLYARDDAMIVRKSAIVHSHQDKTVRAEVLHVPNSPEVWITRSYDSQNQLLSIAFRSWLLQREQSKFMINPDGEIVSGSFLKHPKHSAEISVMSAVLELLSQCQMFFDGKLSF